MRATLLVLVCSAVVAVNATAAAPPCSVSSTILNTLQNPVAATDAQWIAARKALDGVVYGRACGTGPADAASRELLFRILAAEMTTDYPAVLREWGQRDGRPVSEGRAEGVMYFQRDFLAYIDRIVTSKDVAHADLILTYAKGGAIAKLGRAVKKDVKKQAGTAVKRIYGVDAQTPQEEAFRAIGYWLNPADPTLTLDEKREFALFVAGALPPDGTVIAGAHTRVVRTIVNSLGNSDVTEIEEKLRTWRQIYENKNGTGHILARLAEESANRVNAKAKKRNSTIRLD